MLVRLRDFVITLYWKKSDHFWLVILKSSSQFDTVNKKGKKKGKKSMHFYVQLSAVEKIALFLFFKVGLSLD